MNNFYLLNEAINLADFTLFKEGMSDLLGIEKTIDDAFLKHDSVWDIPVVLELYSNFGNEEQAISKFIEQTTSIEIGISDENTFDTFYPDDSNAFMGIDFEDLGITKHKQIKDNNSFLNFKNENLWDLSFRNFWAKRAQLFPNLILCGEVEAQVSRIGDSSFFNQIVERLRSLDKASAIWEKANGDFSYKAVNRDFPLKISPESDKTMQKHGVERLFSLPDGRRNYFELHIKTGELRFHFYPDNIGRKIYVGYIGPHLSI